MKVEKDKKASIALALARLRAKKADARKARQPITRANGIIVRPQVTNHFATLQLTHVPPSDVPRASASSLLARFYKLNRHVPAPISCTFSRVQSFSESVIHPSRWHIVCYGHFLCTVIKSHKGQHQVQLRYRDSDNTLHWIATATLALSPNHFWKQDILLARFKRTIRSQSFYMAAHSANHQIPL